MGTVIGFSGPLINSFIDGPAILPQPLKHFVQAINILRFGRCAKRAVYSVKDNPAYFAAGVMTKLALGDSTFINVASQIALISRCTFELYEAQTRLKRAWGDLSSITDKVPIQYIKHACLQKKSFSQRLIKRLPSPLAKSYVKIQDISHVIIGLTGALWAYLACWDALYCACNLNTISKFSANIEVYSNIKASYKKLCEDGPHLKSLLHATKGPINVLLSMAKVQVTAEDLIQKITSKNVDSDFLKSKIFTVPQRSSTFQTALSLIQKTAFTIVQLATNLPIAITPIKVGDTHQKQPTLPMKDTHGYNSGSHKTCKNSSGCGPRRFYRTA